MKKYIFAALMMLSLSAYGEKLDLNEYRNIFYYSQDGFSVCMADPISAVKLINKIEDCTSDDRKEVLCTMLEIEIEVLEDKIHEHDKNHESLQIISEWRDKYLNQLSVLTNP